MSIESTSHGDIFVTTRWTVVLNAAGDSSLQAARAMEEICRIYWFPLYAYIRRRGHSPEDAEDLTQEFFRQLLEKQWIAEADRNKGKLRAFLITALKHFMAKEWRKASAKKRGSGRHMLSLDSSIAEGRYASTDFPQIEAEALFDRQWALTLLDLTLKRLELEYADNGKTELFKALKNGLVMAHASLDYPRLARQLDMTEGAVRVTVHRMRKRFRELYRSEIAQTLPPGSDLDEELRHLAGGLVRAE
ncbi:MAG: sigma-70 family RNA polymerase sigma factor [Pontiellaceae bacterium]|nr:sigma-70 family RNA polymerase sigma factor [Pontiellaceae bacterium]MBN2783821.1 sigma-70 family RNA polymerase sigma factor [Pontiellaceae bacterium]